MTNFGKITTYDSGKAAGTITPEAGGEPFMFAKADLKHPAEEPKVGQRYGYETKQTDGGKPQAINLQHELSQREQAENQKG